MSFFDDFLTTAAPIAAGALFGPGGAALAAGSAGTAIAAGAATGAGIAALSGDDPLMGAVSGGMGGYGGAGIGQGLRDFGAKQSVSQLTAPATNYVPGATMGGFTPSATIGPLGATQGAVGATNAAGSLTGSEFAQTGLSQGTKGAFKNPGQFLSDFGGGSKFKGAIKLGSAGLPGIGQALVPDYNANPDDDPMSKYDPKRRLNVNMPTGIQNAMTRDSGLRLNQPFARFAEGGYLPYRFQDSGNFTPEDQEAYRQYMMQRDMREPSKDVVYDEDYSYSDPVRRDQFGEMLEGIKSIPQNVREGTQFYLDQYREKKQNEAAEQQFRDDYPELQREIDTGRTAEEEMRLRKFFRNDMAQGGYLETGMGDGMSDDIPSSIDGAQPAALSENEFVIPADVVSHLGNGSSDAGAQQLYAMMDRVRKARTGNEEQGRDIMPQEYMPA